MAPPSGLHQSAISSDPETPFPPLVRSSTATLGLRSHRADPARLAPEDAYASLSPPRRLGSYNSAGNGSGTDSRPHRLRRNDTSRSRSRRRKRFQKLLWVKQSYPDNYTDQATFLENLQRNPRVRPYDFWPLVADSTVIVQHVCSVIIFVVCFVGIFQERVSPVSVVGWGSFATFLGWLLWDRWVMHEMQGRSTDDDIRARMMRGRVGAYRGYGPPRRQDSSGLDPSMLNASTVSISSVSNLPSAASSTSNLLQDHHQSQHPPQTPGNTAGSNSGLLMSAHALSRSASSINSMASHTNTNTTSATTYQRRPSGPDGTDPAAHMSSTSSVAPAAPAATPARNSRAYVRVTTIKSAILIYFTLLGLSPILKSLTRSTSSDSIWAMSFWLLALNVFFFDYSGSSWAASHGQGHSNNDLNSSSNNNAHNGSNSPGLGPPNNNPRRTQQQQQPVASLSTNAALMASTVLASRLPSTGQVFSLTLFSIEVFGLFPVFRQCARRRSWRYHALLTALLVLGAGAGVGMILGDVNEQHNCCGAGGGGSGWVLGLWGCWPWKRALLGMLVGCLISALAMGGCSWWLIGLQKYKNEIYGPWDPARPIIISRRHWDDE